MSTFEERKAKWKDHKRVDNVKLYAGSPMYYYCRLCGAEMVLPEDHLCMAPWFCDDCIMDGLALGPNTPMPAALRPK